MAEERVEEILWTDSAIETFDKNVKYLQKEWTEKEVEKFVQSVETVISTLKRYPEMCRPSVKKKHVRVAIVNKHIQMFYHYNPKRQQIEILLFWNFKQDSKKHQY